MEKENLIMQIKKKKELSSISDGVVSDLVDSYLKKNNFSFVWLSSISKHDEKILVNELRSQLRLYFGRFHSFKKVSLDIDDPASILLSHSSTKERIDFYPRLKEIISRLNPQSILDLACGLNPIALSSPGIKYYASDIDESELKLISSFFEKNNIDGQVFISDLKDTSVVYPQADICLLFKVLDILEKKGHKISEHLIKSINANYILVSFATKTLSGKPMTLKRRYWLERLVKRLGFTLDSFLSSNEIFYLIKKS